MKITELDNGLGISSEPWISTAIWSLLGCVMLFELVKALFFQAAETQELVGICLGIAVLCLCLSRTVFIYYIFDTNSRMLHWKKIRPFINNRNSGSIPFENLVSPKIVKLRGTSSGPKQAQTRHLLLLTNTGNHIDIFEKGIGNKIMLERTKEAIEKFLKLHK